MTPSFCIKCGRLFCSHTGRRFEDARFTQLAQLEPVETTAGEAARQAALSILVPRHRSLEERSRAERTFSEIELQHMEALALTISQLEGMAPTGPLEPSRDPGRLAPVLT